MTLSPSITELLARARADFRMGVPVVLTDDGCSAVAVPVETLDKVRLQDFVAIGPLTLAITARRAETLKARSYDDDIARIKVPMSANLDWIGAVADPSMDLKAAMKGPLVSIREGNASVYRAAILMAKEARLLPAVLTVDVDRPIEFSKRNGLTFIDLKLASPVLSETSPLHSVVSANLPLEVSENSRLHVFRPEDGAEEHYAVEIGRPDRAAPVLARLHSACFTGDLLGSLKCDCGPQLRAALKKIGEEGAGVLLYLSQEGRGIGLANKMRAYSLQDQGFDTVEANHRLGFEDDERDFRIGAGILKELGFRSVRLMTNNPAKVRMMKTHGVNVVDRVPLKVGLNPLNAKYLDTKAKKSGHIL